MELAQPGSQADHMSAARYPVRQEVNNIPPQSAPSGSFLQNAQRPSYHANGTSRGGMAHRQNTSSMTQPNGPSHQIRPVKSDNNAPTNPSIVALNPAYAPSQDMTHRYSHPGSGMYAQPWPDRAGYVRYGGAPLTLGHPVYAENPASTGPQSHHNNPLERVKPLTVCHFDPCVQREGRKRRSRDEIERIYKCGWNGCEKGYGRPNHLNSHVTMQSHGQRRTPNEFKKIREEWKQRKKEEEEEANRKHQGERQRQAATAAAAQNGGGESWEPCVIHGPSYAGLNVPLCPSGYQLGPQQHFIAQKSTYDRRQHSQSCEQPSQFPSSAYDIQIQGVTS